MAGDVAKCNVTDCEKYPDCLYGKKCKSKIAYDFKYFCKEQDKYSEWFEGQFRVVENVKREEINEETNLD